VDRGERKGILLNQTLQVKIVKRIFSSEETGFSVFRATAKTGQESVTLVGHMFDAREGDFLEVEGRVVDHPRFGEQFQVDRFVFLKPQDTEGLVKYLASGRIKGLGPKTAEKIVAEFGLDTLEVLENQPDRLRHIKGLRRGVIEEIARSMREDRVVRDLTVRLAPYGIGKETIFKIHREFGEQAPEILGRNPYCLIEKIPRIGFKTADTIAQSYGIAPDDGHRIAAGLDFLIAQVEQSRGDLYLEEAELLERCAKLLDIEDGTVATALDDLVHADRLIREEIPEPVVLDYKNYYVEKATARLLHQYTEASLPEIDGEVIPDTGFEGLHVDLTQEQKEAIRSALRNKLTIITGGPGTGKTTIIRAIIQVLIDRKRRILIAAPTGRAAKRIEETSHFAASTVHRMLKVKPETREFMHNENNPLPADAIILDEFSMVDTFLFYALLRAIPRHAAIILIGDKDQLPSVGPGNLLRDMIGSGYFNTIYLNRNFRQTENSLIIENAYRINQGEPLVTRPYSEDLDFVYLRVADDRMALDKALRIIEYHRREYPVFSADLQILVPMYRGEAGIDAINRAVQERFNPEPYLIRKERVAFKRLDKVMQLKNNYEKEIFNGEVGMVADYDAETQTLVVDFDGYFIEYQGDELDELTPAYAISIHKSQGSEYETVILVLLPGHGMMLNREIFYTAISRAKRKIFLLSTDDTIRRAIQNSMPRLRKTLLPRRLQELFENGGLASPGGME